MTPVDLARELYVHGMMEVVGPLRVVPAGAPVGRVFDVNNAPVARPGRRARRVQDQRPHRDDFAPLREQRETFAAGGSDRRVHGIVI